MTNRSKNLIIIVLLMAGSVVFAGFALFAGSQGQEQSYQMSGGALAIFLKVFPVFGKLSYTKQMFYIRRMAHAFLYSGMGLFFSGWVMRCIRKRPVAIAVSVMGPLIVSCLDELVIQVGAAGRNGSIKDVFFDMIFVCVMVAVTAVVSKKVNKRDR
ncbi:MAG: VanZ family protein [Bacillota bacterium]|nr:VanZ family protein [Bacillota bacterium]